MKGYLQNYKTEIITAIVSILLTVSFNNLLLIPRIQAQVDQNTIAIDALRQELKNRAPVEMVIQIRTDINKRFDRLEQLWYDYSISRKSP